MTEPRPVRLQLSRKKGFNLQAWSREVNGLPAVNCARPSKWGNPFPMTNGEFDRQRVVDRFRLNLTQEPTLIQHQVLRVSKGMNGRGVGHFGNLRATIAELRNANLACWCHLCARHAATGKPLDEPCLDCAPCHVDPLGGLANTSICEAIP